jgi:hypothetical protein
MLLAFLEVLLKLSLLSALYTLPLLYSYTERRLYRSYVHLARVSVKRASYRWWRLP